MEEVRDLVVVARRHEQRDPVNVGVDLGVALRTAGRLLDGVHGGGDVGGSNLGIGRLLPAAATG
jgi:hypothetical protein